MIADSALAALTDAIEADLASIGTRMIWRDGNDDAMRAAFARAANLEAYEGVTDPGRLAAAVAVSIGRHRHPLVDGNKRAAALALETMLVLHDLTLDVSNRDLEAQFRALAETPDIAAFERALADWITANAIPVL